MASTYTLISSNTLSSSAASVTFSSIPSTYTDLVLRISARTDASGGTYDSIYVYINSDTANASARTLYGNGATAGSGSLIAAQIRYSADQGGNTSNTFSNVEIYIPSYTASQYKPFSSFQVIENNATTAYIASQATLYSQNTAISSLLIKADFYPSNFVSGSSFYLYGIRSS
jgi:hypothetical protein